MTAVPAVCGGSVADTELGFTLMHEHIFVLSPEVTQNWPETFGDEQQRIAGAVAALNRAKAAGVDTIVDLTVIGAGRCIPLIQRVAAQTPVNIVVATGVYTWNDLPFFFGLVGPGALLDGPESMDDFFVRDIEEGIGATGVRAGILKCATDRAGLTYGVERVLRSVARAHRRTGAPISTHTDGVRTGALQQQVFDSEGVDLTRVVIGHVDRTPDLDADAVERLVSRGSVAGFDTFGLTLTVTDEHRLDVIAQLCARGYADRIVVSHDHASYLDWLYVGGGYDAVPGPENSYAHICETAVPGLRARGVREEHIRQITIGNPARILGSIGRGGY
jgi:phosphotriesterase-related protein